MFDISISSQLDADLFHFCLSLSQNNLMVMWFEPHLFMDYQKKLEYFKTMMWPLSSCHACIELITGGACSIAMIVLV